LEYSISHISAVVEGVFKGSSESRIARIITDSRVKSNAELTLFIAIHGERNNGHDYLFDVYNRGYRNFMVETLPDVKKFKDASWIIVPNTLIALQKLAADQRKQYSYPVVAITGSNGKTIVKEWIYQVLHKKFTIVRSPKSYNSQIGVPLSVLNMGDQHDLAIFEAGISMPGEMEKLQAILQPDIGIFTNIGDAHGSGFGNINEKIQEKLKLFISAKTLIYRASESILNHVIQEFAKTHSIKLFSWSTDSKADVSVAVEAFENTSQLTLSFRGTSKILHLPFADVASIENAVHTWMLASLLDMDHEDVEHHFIRLSPIEMRLNQRAGINNCNLVCDFYNSDLTSLEIALNWADRQFKGERKTIILSEIEQADIDDASLYSKVNDLLVSHNYHRIIGVGKRISANRQSFNTDTQHFFDQTEDLVHALDKFEFENEGILIKGGRKFRFEEIEKRLQKQIHNTVLEVNMNALQHNLNYFKSKLIPTTKIMVMVKAYSYGSGGHEIAHFLQYHGVDYLAVAYADEGIALRKDGIKIPIMVMNSDEDSYSSMVENELEPEIFSFGSLNSLKDALKYYPNKSCKIHIEFNSGMHRLGFDMSDAEKLGELLLNSNQLEVSSIFSHLAASDIPEMAAYTGQQIMRFNDFYEVLSSCIDAQPLKHILNSTGILHHPSSQFDMVRLGIGLYGIDPSEVYQDQLEFVGTLWSNISQIREVDANDGIGYGKLSPSTKTRKIAVVAIGYADGLNRGLSREVGYFTVNGKKAPIIGNICMDMTMCDVTDIDCKEGDAVMIFGQSPTIVEIAQQLNTISYEVLTSVSQRVKRIFTEE